MCCQGSGCAQCETRGQADSERVATHGPVLSTKACELLYTGNRRGLTSDAACVPTITVPIYLHLRIYTYTFNLTSDAACVPTIPVPIYLRGRS
eukprot:7989170-Pyramimonas_sp.AAC.1